MGAVQEKKIFYPVHEEDSVTCSMIVTGYRREWPQGNLLYIWQFEGEDCTCIGRVQVADPSLMEQCNV